MVGWGRQMVYKCSTWWALSAKGYENEWGLGVREGEIHSISDIWSGEEAAEVSRKPSGFLAQLRRKHSSFALSRWKVLFNFLCFQSEFRGSRMCQSIPLKKFRWSEQITNISKCRRWHGYLEKADNSSWTGNLPEISFCVFVFNVGSDRLPFHLSPFWHFRENSAHPQSSFLCCCVNQIKTVPHFFLLPHHPSSFQGL